MRENTQPTRGTLRVHMGAPFDPPHPGSRTAAEVSRRRYFVGWPHDGAATQCARPVRCGDMLSALGDRLEKNCWSRGVTRCSDAWDGELNACDRRRSELSAFSCQMFQVGVSYLFDAICSARHRLLCEIYASSKTRAPAGAQMLCVLARPWILRRRSFARSAPSCVRV